MTAITRPTPGRTVLYRTDGRNGLTYDLPAIITCTVDSHPGNYPDGAHNPLPVPSHPTRVHLTVLTPGGFGTVVHVDDDPYGDKIGNPADSDYINAASMTPGTGTYVEWDVPAAAPGPDDTIPPRTWRYPPITLATVELP